MKQQNPNIFQHEDLFDLCKIMFFSFRCLYSSSSTQKKHHRSTFYMNSDSLVRNESSRSFRTTGQVNLKDDTSTCIVLEMGTDEVERHYAKPIGCVL